MIAKKEDGSVIDQVIPLTKETKVEIVEGATPRFIVENSESESVLLSSNSNEEINRWVTVIKGSTEPLPSLSMDLFDIVSVIGRGFYGKVMLCKKKDTGEIFAIKSIRKSRLIETGKTKSIITERNIMMRAHHPFIVNLCFAFQTESKFYFGMEYVPGGELFYHMERLQQIQIDDARLYVAEIGLALDYLHSLGIIYRDLKPENVILDRNGHVKITDFGLSKETDSTDETASTFCGTAEYLAPELVLQVPYSYPVDIWALGILTYEMILGTTPFYHENNSRMLSKIVSNDPEFPPGLDIRIVDFIQKMLTKDQHKRPKFSEMMSHPFFEGFDWDGIYKREYRPNFIPQIKDILIANNFDKDFTNELPADSYVAPPIEESGNVPGFSYTSVSINNLQV